jgi:hypothetical protein
MLTMPLLENVAIRTPKSASDSIDYFNRRYKNSQKFLKKAAAVFLLTFSLPLLNLL